MPINRTYSKALYSITASVVENYLSLAVEYYTDWNPVQETSVGHISDTYLYPLSSFYITLNINIQTGINETCSCGVTGSQFILNRGDFVWHGNEEQIVDPAYLQSSVYAALGL